MKNTHAIAGWLMLLAIPTFNLQPSIAHAQGTAFSYQGRLDAGGNPANGSYDLKFTLCDASISGTALGSLTNAATTVSNGLFMATLDFGEVFNGSSYWLEIAVRTNGSDVFSTLSPRQPITPSPQAIYAANSGNAAFATQATIAVTATTATTIGGVGSTNVAQLSVSNTTIQATGAVTVTSGFITSATLISGGSGYTAAPSVTVLDVTGSNAVITATVSNSVVIDLSVQNPGSHYSTGATLTIAPPPSNAYQTFASGNIFTGVNIFNSPSNTFIGSFRGTFAGSFAGNGSGLTNLTAATIATPPGMALIPAGVFTMGDTLDGESDATLTNVTVSAFYMDMNLVSYSQWQSVYYWAIHQGYSFVNTGLGKGPNHPVQSVNWYDVAKWCNARSQQAGKTPVYYTDAALTQVYTTGQTDAVYPNWTANGYRLPTEAEWEKAARGGLSGQRFPWGNTITESLANYKGDTNDFSYDLGPNGYNAIGSVGGTSPATSPVGSFAPNGYGLFDMSGNVNEWCWDWYGTPYQGGADPRGPASGIQRIVRGGDWYDVLLNSRCAWRNTAYPALVNYFVPSAFGFRCVSRL